MAGLLVAALVAAAMSSIDTSLNSSATVIFFDIYRTSQLSQLRLTRRTQVSDREAMRILRLATILVGAAGTGTALAMIGVQSLLSAWWTLSGIFAGGMFGLFLLGFASRKALAAHCQDVVAGGLSAALAGRVGVADARRRAEAGRGRGATLTSLAGAPES